MKENLKRGRNMDVRPLYTFARHTIYTIYIKKVSFM